MSQNKINITSNNAEFLENIYNHFRDERLDVDKKEIPVKDAMGVDFVINFNIDPTHIIALITMVKYCIFDKKCKIFLKNPDKEDQIIDAELLDKPQDVIDLIQQDENSELYIEHKDAVR